MIIDFHSHILPGLDHGSDGLETTKKQLQMAKKAGLYSIVATSHFYPQRESVSEFLNRREEAWSQLQTILPQFQITVLLGAEVLLCSGMDRMENLEKLCIQDTKVLLLEMPYEEWSHDLIETVWNIKRQGYRVVMAHIERYGKKNAMIALEQGWEVQINASYRKSISKRRIVSLYKREQKIVALGSDIHGTQKAYQVFYRTYKKWGSFGKEVMERTNNLLKKERQA